ncbi:MAG: urea ABC transporter permease subunit UrtC [Actinomycetota bacterium]
MSIASIRKDSTRSAWIRRGTFLAIGLLLLVVAPALLSGFRLALLGKYLCFAIVAIGIDIAWGYGGMLTLGQGVFFGLGAYCMGMMLKLQEVGPGRLPDFMAWSGIRELPTLWKPFYSAWFAIPAAILVPMAVAAALGAAVFRRRVRGPYFAIMSQALVAAFAVLLVGQQALTGGTNGLTNITRILGYDLNNTANRRGLYFVAVLCLGATYLLARQVVQSRYGRVLMAVRDREDRVRFLGYNPTIIKVVAFSLSAGMAGLAGALFVPTVGIISPATIGVVPSIEMVIWVALGGRGTLIGAVIGAVLVNLAKTSLSEAYPGGWLYLQGLLFVVVIAFAPKGLAGLAKLFKRRTGIAGQPQTDGSTVAEPPSTGIAEPARISAK